MKKVKCSNKKCFERRPHFESMEDTRKHVMIEVEDDHEGEMFCSITCACMAGAYNVNTGFIPIEDRK